jgi:phosphate uptake regulator
MPYSRHIPTFNVYGGIKMEYRRLISFGKSSFVVSLPKGWVVQNKLKKGDLIYFEESGPNLVLTSNADTSNDKEKESVINVDGKNVSLIDREVSSAYIQNCKCITLKGKEIKSKVKELQGTIQNLMALEVMEQNPDAIIAKDFLNMETVSAKELVRKMDIVARTMLSETADIFSEDNSIGIAERDKDVDRLYFLLYRAILFNLENPTIALKKFKLRSVELTKYLFYGFYIEGVADEAKRTSSFLSKLKISRSEKEKIESILKKLNQLYLDTMKTIYNEDAEKALSLSEQKAVINKDLDKIERNNVPIEQYGKAIARLRILLSNIHNLGRVVYTLSNY